MSSDPAIDEIRERRKNISRRFDDDVQRYGEHLMQLQEDFADQLIRSPVDLGKKTPKEEQSEAA